jgi:glutaryl-CoA dehydrogenase
MTVPDRRSACTVLGADGITLEHPVSRHMSDLESVLTYAGASEIDSSSAARR